MGKKVIPITKNKTSDEIEKEISIFRLGYDMDNPDSMINYIRNLTMQRLQKLNITKSDDLEIADHNILLGALRTYIEILEKDSNKNKEKKMTWGEYKIFKQK